MPGGPCAQLGEPRGPPVTQRGAGSGSSRPRRVFALVPAPFRYKGSPPPAPLQHAPSTPSPSFAQQSPDPSLQFSSPWIPTAPAPRSTVCPFRKGFRVPFSPLSSTRRPRLTDKAIRVRGSPRFPRIGCGTGTPTRAASPHARVRFSGVVLASFSWQVNPAHVPAPANAKIASAPPARRAAAPAAPWAVPSVPRAASAKGLRTSAAAVPEGGESLLPGREKDLLKRSECAPDLTRGELNSREVTELPAQCAPTAAPVPAFSILVGRVKLGGRSEHCARTEVLLTETALGGRRQVRSAQRGGVDRVVPPRCAQPSGAEWTAWSHRGALSPAGRSGPRGPTERGGRSARPGRGLCARAASSVYKLNRAFLDSNTSPTGSRTSTLPLALDGHTSSPNGPQLLLLHWLLLLLPCGLCQVCPGLHLQRGLGQVQLLCLMSGRACPRSVDALRQPPSGMTLPHHLDNHKFNAHPSYHLIYTEPITE
ncbi:hypothetical protein E5288_WYG003183 [Bos mutus]|uniref:Uncharacterized protein n=1 Tax=Bos mutus TaxID=72004 RepID=A0A6B0R8F2_9CETA|nr:hypothetical protein [Bos mutus]